jgi:hypothetical protein
MIPTNNLVPAGLVQATDHSQDCALLLNSFRASEIIPTHRYIQVPRHLHTSQGGEYPSLPHRAVASSELLCHMLRLRIATTLEDDAMNEL